METQGKKAHNIYVFYDTAANPMILSRVWGHKDQQCPANHKILGRCKNRHSTTPCFHKHPKMRFVGRFLFCFLGRKHFQRIL